MIPTFRERLVALNIRLKVRLGLMTYGRQQDGSINNVTVTAGTKAVGFVSAKIHKASTNEWRDYGIISSPNPSLLTKIKYRLKVRKINKWLRS